MHEANLISKVYCILSGVYFAILPFWIYGRSGNGLTWDDVPSSGRVPLGGGGALARAVTNIVVAMWTWMVFFAAEDVSLLYFICAF